jgi:hypothetical protein
VSERDVVKIGNSHGRIAIYCDETEALDLAAMYTYPDGFGREILDAVERAYPPESNDEERFGLTIMVELRDLPDDAAWVRAA